MKEFTYTIKDEQGIHARPGRGSNRSTWQILRGETVRNSSGNRLRRMNQQKDEVTL